MPGKVVEAEFTHLIQGGAGRGNDFLGVLNKTCQEQGVPVTFTGAPRPAAGGVALKAPIGNGLQLETFAKDQGPHLQVGWEVATTLVGGNVLGGIGMFGEINRFRTRGQNNANKMRDVEATWQMFRDFAFMPVVQQLSDALAQQRGRGSTNGFLGA